MNKKYRIKKNQDFQKAYKKAKRYYNRDLTILVVHNSLETKRFGFTLSRKFGKANKRNKVRRKLKEIIRSNLDRFDDGFDYVIIPKTQLIEMTYQEIEKTLFHCLKRIKKWVN